MFEYKIDGALDIGSNNLKLAFYKKKQITSLHCMDYMDVDEEKIIILQESLEILGKEIVLKNKNLIVTLPASQFTIQILEYSDFEDDTGLNLRIEDDLENAIDGYDKSKFITQIETICEEFNYKKILIVTISTKKIEQILEILNTFKIRVLKITPDILSINNIVTEIEKKSDDIEKNVMVVDICGENSNIFVSNSTIINTIKIINIGENDFTGLIQYQQLMSDPSINTEKKLSIDEFPINENNNENETKLDDEFLLLIDKLIKKIKKIEKNFNLNSNEGKIDKILLTGGKVLLDRFETYFESHFDIPCKIFNLDSLNLNYKNIEIKEKVEDSRLATIFGSLIDKVI